MKPLSEDQLTATLGAMRPAPRPAFAAELDARAAAGFPRKSRPGDAALSRLGTKLRSLKPRRLILPVGATALAAVVVATVVVSNSGSGGTVDQMTSGAAESAGSAAAGRGESFDSAAPSVEAGAIEEIAPPSQAGNAAGTAQRDVERSAEITLGTDPANLGDAAAEVFDAVHRYRGIVLDSSTTEGVAGEAEAEFNLLIPSAKLGDALAAFSGIAEVRSRHEATTDITAPTVGVTEHLADSSARIDSLLGQLADASTEEEREVVEAELAGERGRNANLRARLERLDSRANLSNVSLGIETGEETAVPEEEGGAWGIGDAFDDAGGILSTAAAVALVGLAILGPIALIALLAWIAHRLWTRQSRARALG
jgi:Domain of unknown function (DUF4349)